MPYSIALVPDAAFLMIEFIGVIEPRDLVQIAGETRTYERGDVVPHRLTDITRVEKISISFEDIFRLASNRKAITFKNPFKSALVVNTDTQLGYARMFQTLNDHPQIMLQIFQDSAAAQVWIKEN